MALRHPKWVLILAAFCGLSGIAHAQGEQLIRVVLSDTGTNVQVGGELSWTSPNGALGSTSGVVDLSLYGSTLEVRIGGRPVSAARLSATPTSGYIRYGGNDYRGGLEFFRGSTGGMVVLNLLSLEDYLLGVVAAEMPASWPPEALKTQAIAARSYALTRIAAHRDATYDVYATVADQAYRGIVGEDPRTTAAVAATHGQVVLYEGEVIVAYYCSDVGGYSREGDKPYLKPVASRHPDSPHNAWTLELSIAELREIVAAAGDDLGQLTGAKLLNDPQSGHLTSIVLIGQLGEHGFTGEQLRKFVGRGEMKSPRVTLQPGNGLGIEAPTVRAVPEEDVPRPLATEITLSAQPNWDSMLQLASQPMQGWERPWVVGDDRPTDLKMRNLFAFNGSDLLKCSREVFLFSGLETGTLAPASAVRTTPALRTPPQAVSETRVTFDRPDAKLVFHGSGYGHGLGMSQWGARKLAEDGLSCEEILRYFYNGTTVGPWGGSLPAPLAVDTAEFYQPFNPNG